MKGRLGGVFAAHRKLGREFYEELEETLILSDVGGALSAEITERLRAECEGEKLKDAEQAKARLRALLTDMLRGERALRLDTSPSVVLCMGVNGAGKTTTAGKLAALLTRRGKKVLLCAADTFRAAAAEQLAVWAERAGAALVRQGEGADPSAVLFDALRAAKARGADVVLADTAGRLQNKQNLMNELSKMSRVISRECPEACRENLLVMDAVTGQNGLAQAAGFSESAALTGIALTKMDGSAKGGVVIAVARAMAVPVKLVGTGEKLDDLREFSPEEFAEDIVS
ncbi:MAG: signal recognition particle-docking protein FtsY [Oscillospiraceae bacterium]|jgi:fused signal recognition particle receptor|nr:signal recognition particle-docking protein FtsY [Oscillospiraceae bacterium]